MGQSLGALMLCNIVRITPRQTTGIVKVTTQPWRVWSLVIGPSPSLAHACHFTAGPFFEDAFGSKMRFEDEYMQVL